MTRLGPDVCDKDMKGHVFVIQVSLQLKSNESRSDTLPISCIRHCRSKPWCVAGTGRAYYIDIGERHKSFGETPIKSLMVH
jgi:hypothetical protein